MGILFLKAINSVNWTSADFKETAGRLENGERGFYQIRGFYITDSSEDEKSFADTLSGYEPSEKLQLVHINLKEFADRPVSQTGISQIRTILKSYEEKDSDLIIRFIYDWDGKSMENEPFSLDTVLLHMEQMGAVLDEFSSCVYIVQGVFMGNWGEMHSSKFLNEDDYKTLIEKMNEVMPEGCFLSVRTPAYWRTAAQRKEPLSEEEAWQEDSLISRLSLFNDGLTGDSYDCGTYGEISQKESDSFVQRWRRSDELDFQNRLNLYVPNGGEAIIENPLNDFSSAVSYFREIHVSYLNKDYDGDVLEKWRNTVIDDGSVYDGMSGYDYMERHLGYRFVVKSAVLNSKGIFDRSFFLNIKIENVGFGCRYTPCGVKILIVNNVTSETREISADTDPRSWKPSAFSEFAVELPELEKGEYSVYIELKETGGGSIVFANEGARDSLYLGRLAVKQSAVKN